ncbi:unnamed protein product [Phytophthora fragariaefolia]|uniref:Unnamed protein product n=1 Tax=Phytophthora fragariaefolia TaxID=1490495 RepID=A0A9W6U1K2_9STRA|nr:unnamed protein product [Phytophthora fragariaefolia]
MNRGGKRTRSAATPGTTGCKFVQTIRSSSSGLEAQPSGQQYRPTIINTSILFRVNTAHQHHKSLQANTPQPQPVTDPLEYSTTHSTSDFTDRRRNNQHEHNPTNSDTTVSPSHFVGYRHGYNALLGSAHTIFFTWSRRRKIGYENRSHSQKPVEFLPRSHHS